MLTRRVLFTRNRLIERPNKNWQCREFILNTEISPHRKRILRRSFDCMTKHDDVIIVYIYMEFFFAKFRHYFLFSLSFGEQVRENDFISRLLGWKDTGWTELTVKSSLLHFFFRILCFFFVCVQFRSEFNHKMKRPCVFLWFPFSLGFWFPFYYLSRHVHQVQVDLIFSGFWLPLGARQRCITHS